MTFDLSSNNTFRTLSWKQCLLLIAVAETVWVPSTRAFVSPNFGYRRRPLSLMPLQFQSEVTTTSLDPQNVSEYTEAAIQYRGEPRGLAALKKLGKHCRTRIPFNFENNKNQKDETVLALQKGLIPSSVTEDFVSQVREMEQKGWLSMNPDSVDGLPSLHLNLVSDGKPIAERDTDLPGDLKRGLQKLFAMVKPYIYEKLLPNVQQLTNDPSIRVSDIFLRRYGDDIGDEGTSRNGISAHYDVFSKVTSVIAMDNTAAEGTNGLFTTEIAYNGNTSNHAALRRFFPLEQGDGVVHTWDVLHGVDVAPNSDRTSLIVWFTTGEVLDYQETMTPPWLVKHPNIDTDNVAQFVLASAMLASTETAVVGSSPEEAAMHHRDLRQSQCTDRCDQHPHDLYLKSAAAGNTFALTRLGSLAQEKELSLDRAKQGLAILESLRPIEHSPFHIDVLNSDGSFSLDRLAQRFWLEGAVRGNPMAQAYLADDIMVMAVETKNEDLRVLAAVLLSLAAQQGNDSASDSLQRVIEFEVAQNAIQSQEEFDSSPVVKAAVSALRH